MNNNLPKWFMNRLHTIMEYNGYSEDMLTTEKCSEKNMWTPTDLILREWYNNGGGSSKGFLGISTNECKRCYEFIKENQKVLKNMDFYNEKGISNFGFTLWNNYEIH